MAFIELTKIVSDRRDSYDQTDEPGEPGSRQGGLRTTKASINTHAIRCFYPRKDNRPGTRLTFTDGGGFACVELYDQIAAMIAA